MTYKPTWKDIAWTKNVIEMVKDGGIWGWPDAGLVIRFNKASKKAIVVNPHLTERQKERIEIAREVFKAVGWTIEPDNFAERINPRNFGFSPKMVAVVGAIIDHDYGVRDRKGGQISDLTITSDGFLIAASTATDGRGAFLGEAIDLERNLLEYAKALAPEDLKLFNQLYRENVTDYRK